MSKIVNLTKRAVKKANGIDQGQWYRSWLFLIFFLSLAFFWLHFIDVL